MTNPDRKSWSKERLAAVYAQVRSQQPDRVADLVAPIVHKPLHQNSIARAILVFSAAGLCALVLFIVFSGSKSPPVADVSPSPGVNDPENNAEGWKAAATQATAGGLAVDVPSDKPNNPPTAKPQVKPSPAIKPTPTPIVKTPAPVATPKIVYRTVYKPLAPPPTRPTPPVAAPKIVAQSKPKPPPSFIPIAGGRSKVNSPTTARTAPKPLASERVLMATRFPTATADRLIAGTTVAGHLMSPMQAQRDRGNTKLQIVLDEPLPTQLRSRIPPGAILNLQATINPQNGAVSAQSLDLSYQGRQIAIPKGTISIQAANKQPLVATAYQPRMGELAAADRQNALLGAVGEVGNELTKGNTSVNVANGVSVIQQTNNTNILGAVFKGGFQSWATDQRQRTQTSASQMIAAQPIQYLAQNTPVLLTVDSPAPIVTPKSK
jgi:hypothetical protein